MLMPPFITWFMSKARQWRFLLLIPIHLTPLPMFMVVIDHPSRERK